MTLRSSHGIGTGPSIGGVPWSRRLLTILRLTQNLCPWCEPCYCLKHLFKQKLTTGSSWSPQSLDDGCDLQEEWNLLFGFNEPGRHFSPKMLVINKIKTSTTKLSQAIVPRKKLQMRMFPGNHVSFDLS